MAKGLRKQEKVRAGKETNEGLGLRPSMLTGLIWLVLPLLDDLDYRRVELAEVRRTVLDGNLLDWLQGTFPDEDFSLFQAGEWRTIQDALRGPAEALDGQERRKAGVERDGLLLLIAYATEAIQWMAPSVVSMSGGTVIGGSPRGVWKGGAAPFEAVG